MADILGLAALVEAGPFVALQLANSVTLDFYTEAGHVEKLAHYAFLVSEAEFDHGLSQLHRKAITYYGTPWLDRAGEFNTNDGGRGLYFFDPTGNTMEFITVP